MADFDVEVDASGLSCPLPMLKCKKALNQLASGQVVQVIATDPGAPADFVDFAKHSGHRLLSSEQQGDRWVLRVQRK